VGHKFVPNDNSHGFGFSLSHGNGALTETIQSSFKTHIPRVALGKFLFFPQQNVSFLAAKRRISESFSIEPLRFCARP
jgi:hypothetical protein